MSENTEEQGGSEQPRDKKGRYVQKPITEDHGTKPVDINDYSKMNAVLQQQSGMSAEKFVQYQQKLTPKELFDRLIFLTENKEQNKQGSKPPPNQDFIPIPPATDNTNDFPGTVVGKSDLSADKFNLTLAVSPAELFGKKKK